MFHPIITAIILVAIAVGAYFVVKAKPVTSKAVSPTTPATGGGGSRVEKD
jgi:hypothetical protein